MVQEKIGKKKSEIKEKEEYVARTIKPMSEKLNKQEHFPQYTISCEIS